LSYSQVRALTRVERVVCEQELLSLARHATASQLERLVRAYRGVVVRACVAAGGGPARYVSWEHADDGSLLLRARLPAEEGAIVLAALQAGVERLADGACAQAPAIERASAEAPALEPAAEPVSAEARAVESVSAEAPAVEPAVESVFAEAPRLGERRADALVLMADTLLAQGPSARGGDRFQVVVHIDAATLRDGDGESELSDGTPVAAQTARRLACDAAIVPLLERAGRPLSVGRKTRSIPPALRRAIARRDRGCRFPGCPNHHTVDAHHIEHWANGGPTSLENLVSLCRHHHRLLHERGYSVTRNRSGLVFRRPDGRELSPCPRKPRGCPTTLRDINQRAAGRPIDPQATVTLWAGEHLELALNVDAPLHFAPPEAPGI
jgi:hypothetical protein